jgi:hypothetical protein
MRKFIFILCIGMIGCTSNTIIKKPDNLIPKDQMVDLLTDMLLSAGGQSVKNIELQRRINYFPIVFEKYNIDSTQFKESNYYYTSRIDDYDEILEKVEMRLKSLKEKSLKERIFNDSIEDFSNDSLRYYKKELIEEGVVK